MTTPAASVVSLRLDASMAELLSSVAEALGMTESITVEKLVLAKAGELGIRKPSSSSAFLELLDEIVDFLKDPKLRRDEHITLTVFGHIKATPRLLKLHSEALRPTRRGETTDKRRLFCHQRIGRFVKDHLGRDSAEEIALPKSSEALIRSYTRLVRS